MEDLPLVSVLLPVHNGGRYLGQCLESLAAQSASRFEIVAVDDGSTDDTAALLGRWQRPDVPLRVFREPHRGLIAALNHGLSQCRGSLIARMDADDRMHPDRLKLQRRLILERSRTAAVSCLVQHFSDSGRVGDGMRFYDRWLNSLIDNDSIQRELYVESPLAHPSVMARTDELRKAGGYRDTGWPEDYDLWLRLARRGARFSKVPQVLHYWREHPGRLTRRDERYTVERFLACKAHHLARGPLASGRPVVVWGAGRTGRRLTTHLGRENVRIRAFVDIDPKKWGRTVRDRPVHPPRDLAELMQASSGRRALLLAAVASRGARQEIRAHLHGEGWLEASDYWCVA